MIENADKSWLLIGVAGETTELSKILAVLVRERGDRGRPPEGRTRVFRQVWLSIVVKSPYTFNIPQLYTMLYLYKII